MLDLGHTQSGSDLDINDLYDESEYVISLTLTMIMLPWRNHMKNIWKGMNLYVSRYTKSEDVIPSQLQENSLKSLIRQITNHLHY